MRLEIPQTPCEAVDHAWSCLRQVIVRPASAWRYPSLSTVDTDRWPRSRTVVLRAVDAEAGKVDIHTDVRSPKFGELRDCPRVSLCFWDGQREKLQLRLRAEVTLHHADAVADEVWRSTPASSRVIYTGELAPGTETSAPESNLPEAYADRLPTEEELAAAADRFVVVRCWAVALDLLRLNRDQSWRVQASRDEDDMWAATFVAP